jgi:hypothetical protein
MVSWPGGGTHSGVDIASAVRRRDYMYMIRNTFRAQRGKAPALIAIFKTLNEIVTAQEGFSHGKIYADMTGPMDTIIWEFEAASLDQFYQMERGIFINPDAATQSLIDNLNGSAVEGRRDIFEVIV